jgi:hypothetical protein
MAERFGTLGDATLTRVLVPASGRIGGQRGLVIGAAVAVAALAITLVALLPEDPLPWLAWDSRTYWDAARATDPYANARVGEIGAYLYSPAFLQVLRPAAAVPWPLFLYLWAAAGVAVAWRLLGTGGLSAPWLVVLGVLALFDVWAGNINLFIAGAIVLGIRWPAAWGFVALTKVSPGLGVAWFAARREWGHLLVAVAVTAGIAAASALADPDAWRAWFGVLVSSNGVKELTGDLAIPAVVRFPVALLVAWWAGRTDRAWLLPVAVVLFLPVIWPNSLAILTASAALVRVRRTAAVGRRADRPHLAVAPARTT